ncbi:MAG TPA: sigma 54-interacting transcriptional regulator, partial [Spirochaetales bacterium]|nr:sigma 54-interacting transcriptional regulator [Spirochaetales bacterium]
MIDKSGRILVLDDDVDVLARMGRVLRFEGWTDVALCERAEDAFAALDEKPAVAMVVDLLMPGMDGYQVLERMREDYPNVPVIVGTAVDDLDAVVRCMKAGAFDYVPKSAESARLLASIEHAALIASLKEDNRALRQSFLEAAKPPSPSFDRIITRDGRMLSIFRYIEAIVASDPPVLISGESGTGKELVARAIHAASGRSGELVAVNVAGLDDTMFSDTLFGHRRGAFTGADTDRPGLFEAAAGGTLFLDEIGDLS